MDKDSKQVVVLLTHPNIKESRANKALMDAISDMGEVAIYNLYEMRMEDAFNAEIWSTIISHASALVFQFPFYWMSAPSLLNLKSATKLFSVLLASKRPLITELADKLRLKYPLLPTISPCPTMRLEAIRSIIPISCRRYPKSV